MMMGGAGRWELQFPRPSALLKTLFYPDDLMPETALCSRRHLDTVVTFPTKKKSLLHPYF